MKGHPYQCYYLLRDGLEMEWAEQRSVLYLHWSKFARVERWITAGRPAASTWPTACISLSSGMREVDTNPMALSTARVWRILNSTEEETQALQLHTRSHTHNTICHLLPHHKSTPDLWEILHWLYFSAASPDLNCSIVQPLQTNIKKWVRGKSGVDQSTDLLFNHKIWCNLQWITNR